MRATLRHPAAPLVIAAVLAAAAHAPVMTLVAWLHEGGHAAAAWLTGGQVLSIGAGPGAGHTLTRGGWAALITLAGYPAPVAAGLALSWPRRALVRGPGLALAASALGDLAGDFARDPGGEARVGGLATLALLGVVAAVYAANWRSTSRR